MVILLIIAFLIIMVIIAVPISLAIAQKHEKAKKEAKQILASGKITDAKHTEDILRVLSLKMDDVESEHLWHKLTELKEKAG
jgi:poly-D-alanine transfer protein DltD